MLVRCTRRPPVRAASTRRKHARQTYEVPLLLLLALCPVGDESLYKQLERILRGAGHRAALQERIDCGRLQLSSILDARRRHQADGVLGGIDTAASRRHTELEQRARIGDEPLSATLARLHVQLDGGSRLMVSAQRRHRGGDCGIVRRRMRHERHLLQGVEHGGESPARRARTHEQRHVPSARYSRARTSRVDAIVAPSYIKHWLGEQRRKGARAEEIARLQQHSVAFGHLARCWLTQCQHTLVLGIHGDMKMHLRCELADQGLLRSSEPRQVLCVPRGLSSKRSHSGVQAGVPLSLRHPSCHTSVGSDKLGTHAQHDVRRC